MPYNFMHTLKHTEEPLAGSQNSGSTPSTLSMSSADTNIQNFLYTIWNLSVNMSALDKPQWKKLPSIWIHKNHLIDFTQNHRLSVLVWYLRGLIKAGMDGLNAVKRTYERLWSMAYRTWQISLSGVLQVSLEVTNVTTYHTRHLYDGILLVLYVAALVASGS